jgi:hypothetical protein
MGTYPWVLACALVVACIVAVLLIWRGRTGQIAIGRKGLRVSVLPEPQTDEVSVVSFATIGGTVGAITGRDSNVPEQGGTGPRRRVVGRGLTIEPGGKAESITGERISSPTVRSKKPTK